MDIENFFHLNFIEFSALAFLLSLSLSYCLYATRKFHLALTGDLTEGVQKIHKTAVPRIGGAALFMTAFLAVCFGAVHQLWGQIIFSVIPIFFAGLIEDISKSVTSLIRLMVSLISACLFVFLFGHGFPQIGIFHIDFVFDLFSLWPFISVLLIAALINSINIIDGFHGLASGATMLMLCSLMAIAYHAGDDVMVVMLFGFIALIFGFFVFNFPKGLLFLGDGGAYFCGFILACLSILLLERNGDIEPLILLIVFSYPMVELLFSMYRKTMRTGHRADQPDRLHFHQLIHRRLKTGLPFRLSRLINANAMTGLVVQIFPLSGLIFILLIPQSRFFSVLYFILFSMIYLRIYKRVSLNG